MQTRGTGSRASASYAKCKAIGLLIALTGQAANFQAMIQHQQVRANLAAHQAVHDAVAYRVMMSQSATNSSMPLNVSNKHSPATARPALLASIFGL